MPKVTGHMGRGRCWGYSILSPQSQCLVVAMRGL